jgi:hypothetical protein
MERRVPTPGASSRHGKVKPTNSQLPRSSERLRTFASSWRAPDRLMEGRSAVVNRGPGGMRVRRVHQRPSATTKRVRDSTRLASCSVTSRQRGVGSKSAPQRWPAPLRQPFGRLSAVITQSHRSASSSSRVTVATATSPLNPCQFPSGCCSQRSHYALRSAAEYHPCSLRARKATSSAASFSSGTEREQGTTS